MGEVHLTSNPIGTRLTLPDGRKVVKCADGQWYDEGSEPDFGDATESVILSYTNYVWSPTTDNAIDSDYDMFTEETP